MGDSLSYLDNLLVNFNIRLLDHAPLLNKVNLIKLKMNLTFICCNKYSILRNECYKKLAHVIPNFKQLSPLQIIREHMTSSNHYINIQLAKFISSCFDLRNIQLSNQTNAT